MSSYNILEGLRVSDVPNENQDIITVADTDVQIILQRTGFGYRRYFICPFCDSKCGKLHRISKKLHCPSCTPLDLYAYRRNLYDEGGTTLIVWQTKRLARKIGITDIRFPFDLVDYLDTQPPGVSWRRYIKTLERIQRMERLRFLIIFRGYRFTATEIKRYTEEAWLFEEDCSEDESIS